MKDLGTAEIFEPHEELIDNFGNMVVLESDGLLAEALEVEGQELQNHRDGIEVVDVVRREDVVDLDDTIVVDAAQDHDFTQGAEGQDAVDENVLINLDGVIFLGFVVAHAVHLAIGARAHDAQVGELGPEVHGRHPHPQRSPIRRGLHIR